jgi:signal transduction histidine kinase
MSPEAITLLPVEVSPRHRAILRDALALAFPQADTSVHAMAGFAEAARRERDDSVEIVVLENASESLVRQALDTTDGRFLPRWAVVVIGADSAPIGAEAVVFDDVEPRLVARALRSSCGQLMLRRRLARERGDLWTIGRRLIHDLRNPVGSIVTSAEMLREILEEEAPAHRPILDPVFDSTGEILDLLNRIHFLTKASALPSPPETFDMEAAHQAAIDRLQREITRTRATVDAPENWPEVYGVRPWLEAVWWNLLANALRHGGSPARIETSWRRDGDHWVFTVTDRGPGVPPERLAHLFVPFDRLHQTHGGGIGLSIVHRLVELQGGRCAYSPRPGGGSAFSFTLPARVTSAPAVTSAAVTTASATSPTLSSSGEPRLARWASPAG